jgi:6-phosphogluconolactonase
MKVEILPDAASVAARVAAVIAAEARAAVTKRGRVSLAVSGGTTPWRMLRELSAQDVPWRELHLFQVDERVAPLGDAERNFAKLCASLNAERLLSAGQVHPMPVEEPVLEAAAARYGELLEELAGKPAVLDVVHLGLGPDGHTASLVPGDPALEVVARDVAVTGAYEGRRRMTLTFPAINRSRHIVWMVVGEDKAGALASLVAGDESTPAGRVRREGALLVADRAAALVARRRF